MTRLTKLLPHLNRSQYEDHLAWLLTMEGIEFQRQYDPKLPSNVPKYKGQANLPLRKWTVDFFILPNILVEVQGGIFNVGKHVRGKGYEEDILKHNTCMLAGYMVLWASPAHVMEGFAIHWIKQARTFSYGLLSPLKPYEGIKKEK